MKMFGRQENSRKKVLAVASGGGHWIQLLRLQQAFCACDCTYVSVNKEYASAVSPSAFFYVPDTNREAKVKLAIAASGALSLFMNTFKLSLAFGKSGLARSHDALRLSFESTVRRTALC